MGRGNGKGGRGIANLFMHSVILLLIKNTAQIKKLLPRGPLHILKRRSQDSKGGGGKSTIPQRAKELAGDKPALVVEMGLKGVKF